MSRFSLTIESIAIDGPIEITPFPLAVDVGFIHIPRPPCLTSSPSAQLISNERGKACFPVSNCLMRELKAPLQEHLGEIAQAQLVPQPPENDEQHDIGGIFQVVERGSGALVEGAL